MEWRYKPLEILFRAFADANRLLIITTIGEDEKSVSQIVEATGLSQPLVSHHLKLLKNSLILKTRREGLFVYYSLSDKSILKILKESNDFIEDFARALKDSPTGSFPWCC
ncbi:metalloregulator ArsR/SmtB family transcription factor [bacterium]|nr:metalloregulator ArsR/SmtB family transcription factor [bacterium]MBU1614077.1 metalloregulator ArsR/SmtB family transcription factor [bacterium]